MPEEPMIHISYKATDEQKKSEAPLLSKCPHCGTETESGFGLAGGGYGVYVYCPKEGCDYFVKTQVNEEL